MIGQLLIFAFALFSHKEDKEKKALHNHAETALSHADYHAAKKSYAELCKKIQKPDNDWQNYVDIVVRYAEVHLLLKEYSSGEALLIDLLNKKPPHEFYPRIVSLLAKLYSFQEEAGKGYVYMREALSLVPLEKWKPEERSFFHAVEYALNSYYENLLQKAKHFAAAGSYSEAIESYQKVADGIEKQYFPIASSCPMMKKKVLFRLAESHFLAADYEKTLLLSSEIASPQDHLDAEMLYLAALCYKEKREYEKSLLYFQNYLHTSDANLLFHYDCALLEIGQFYYRNGNKAEAKIYLEKLLDRKESVTRPVLIGLLTLGKIYCSEKIYPEAEKLFCFVQDKLDQNDSLHFEAAYYLGDLAFENKQWQKALAFFEKALLPSMAKGDWIKSALYKLALCYSRQTDPELVKRGEEILEKFLLTQFDEEIILALCDLYASEKNIAKFESLKSQAQNHLSFVAKNEILLLEASLKENYEEKAKLLHEIVKNETCLPSELLAKTLYASAMNEIFLGMKVDNGKEIYFKKAIESLQKAFILVENDDKAASKVLRLEIKAHCLLKDQKLALALFQRLNNDLENKEKLYLKALLLSQMDNLEYQTLAAKTFEDIVNLYPNSEFADDALYALSTFYYRQENYFSAEESFLKLAEQYPQSCFADVSFYWAAESSEKRGENFERSQFLRKECFEKYPCSPKASEAYFKYYRLDDYLQGDEKALVHIRSFPALYPASEWLPLAYFIIGFHESSYPLAKINLEKALELFNAKQQTDSSFILFRYRTMLELARFDMKYGQDMNEALKILLKLVSELRDGVSLLKDSAYPRIYEECEFSLFQIYLHLKKETLAYEVLLSMLKHYSEAGIREGFYLSEVWKEQGLLSMNASDYSTALSCFEIALECGEKYLTTDQRFSVFLLKSNCYKMLKEYDESMKNLSEIINENTDSNLRLKAMFLRAEIYELQGRNELSLRQLISLSKQEGKWALEAREKLRKSYGIHE